MRCYYRNFIFLFFISALCAYPAFPQDKTQASEDAPPNAIQRQGDSLLNSLMDNLRMNRFDEVDKHAGKTLAFLKEHALTDAMYMAYKQQILSYCRRGMYEKALAEIEEVYQQARRQNDDESSFYMQYLMGVVYMHQDRLSEAEEHYRQSIEEAARMNKRPFGLIGVYFELCNMLQATGRFDAFFEMAGETEKLLEGIIRENPDNPQHTNRNNLWTLYAFAYSFMGDFDKTESYCNRIDSLREADAVSLGNTTYLRAQIWEARGDYDKALTYIDRAIEIDPTYSYARFTKVRILSRKENAPLTWAETEKTVTYIDSLRDASFNRQLDELHTQYEVDKHIAEKEKTRHFMYFALAGCVLLLVTLGIRIYYNRKIMKKNKTLAKQIKELQTQHEKAETTLLNKTSFVAKNGNSNLCPEKRKEQLCMDIRDMLLKEKAYHDPGITRDRLIARLGTHKDLFIEAFQQCFGMSFTEYVNFLRLKEAITLLERSELPIEEISEKVGFGSVRTLQRQFQVKYNMSPKDYRKATIA
ncbi:MAG: helix-turn-helix domain-containing protein [Proteiniphilum sp.]|jgi:AraC-like DNA-binding protein/Flp pilus assembly protein TadD|uniref:helix-turn-helix domain-containing protein n=1 Tax=Proteiniphilum sp. TaxID=1926877 RepID=UPI00092B463B|nr:helix-turn-helix domain-containing protein [Proteiniphilum sp.]MEA5129222.1 helix-turn-helix domain-containing protein [Proteiniphilum sp.]OJV85998.1 MAG: hypothetical protein BGO34_18940 [Bacteroidia bacterium 44-10]